MPKPPPSKQLCTNTLDGRDARPLSPPSAARHRAPACRATVRRGPRSPAPCNWAAPSARAPGGGAGIRLRRFSLARRNAASASPSSIGDRPGLVDLGTIRFDQIGTCPGWRWDPDPTRRAACRERSSPATSCRRPRRRRSLNRCSPSARLRSHRADSGSRRMRNSSACRHRSATASSPHRPCREGGHRCRRHACTRDFSSTSKR